MASMFHQVICFCTYAAVSVVGLPNAATIPSAFQMAGALLVLRPPCIRFSRRNKLDGKRYPVWGGRGWVCTITSPQLSF